jgi:hypothetical protein
VPSVPCGSASNRWNEIAVTSGPARVATTRNVGWLLFAATAKRYAESATAAARASIAMMRCVAIG